MPVLVALTDVDVEPGSRPIFTDRQVPDPCGPGATGATGGRWLRGTYGPRALVEAPPMAMRASRWRQPLAAARAPSDHLPGQGESVMGSLRTGLVTCAVWKLCGSFTGLV